MSWRLQRRDLTTLAQTWSVLSYSNLAPTSHTFDLNLDRARLVYGLVTRMDMSIGALISGHISLIAQSNSSRLGFPTLIIALCKVKGVTSDSLSYESLSPAINLDPLVPTSAPSPAPAHPGPSTNLIMAMLQSLYQGQYLLMQNFQNLAQHQPLISLEEFTLSVAWWPG
ncbi:hypothetical protein GmHk_09G025466 [Glycine max]|nr:hypothetical protein GmHk_09G025466 [Glycine max]